LKNGGFAYQESPSDLTDPETTQRAQGEGHLSFRERGVTAGENQTQLIVGHG
jgi:hypothetical protein